MLSACAAQRAGRCSVAREEAWHTAMREACRVCSLSKAKLNTVHAPMIELQPLPDLSCRRKLCFTGVGRVLVILGTPDSDLSIEWTLGALRVLRRTRSRVHNEPSWGYLCQSHRRWSCAVGRAGHVPTCPTPTSTCRSHASQARGTLLPS